MKKISKTIHLIISTFPISAYISYTISAALNLKDKCTTVQRAAAFGGGAIAAWAVLIGLLCLVNASYKVCAKKSSQDGLSQPADELLNKPTKKSLLNAALVTLAPLFIIYIYLPAETFFHSYSDYNFPYWILLKSLILEFICVWYTATYILSMLNAAVSRKVQALVLGFTLAIYVQYMFFNQNVGIVDGHPFVFKEHMVLASVNIIVWAALITIPLIIAIKSLKSVKTKNTNDKPNDNPTTNTPAATTVTPKLSAAILALHILTFAMLLISADKQCYHYSSVYFDYSEQYTVGSGKNIVLFIIDEADNKFIKELYQEGKISHTFDDYIIYTNTCSVYDFTNLSMLQMVTNYPFDNTLDASTRRANAWGQDSVNDFYDRFHQAGYKVNFFNFDYENSEGVIGKMDNARVFDEKNDTIQYINYKNIKKQSDALTAYRLLPIVLKPTVDMTLVSSPDPVIIYSTNTGYYENRDFDENMELKLGDSDNYLIIHHTKGLHMPDNNVETMEYCLGSVEKYIEQMKALGVYDNASIIITADHGSHDECTGDTWAATPMFMIRVGVSESPEAKDTDKVAEGPTLSDAPIYHTDIMPTLLYEAGLYYGDSAPVSETKTDDQQTLSDTDTFGKTVFDYKDGDLRERTWYNRRYDPAYPKREKYNVYYGYTYTGNTETLEKMVEEDQQTVYTVPMKNE
ncbi:MAG TPA: hypothetical protein DCP07_07230 [Lachnospiraceae bacterium]|nr:hypothetical protein [Lachnospiraceae bacterium]